MSFFYELAEKEVPNFGGIYYADGNLDQAAQLRYKNQYAIMASATTMFAAYSMGFEAFSMTAMNFVPETLIEFYNQFKNYQFKEALVTQKKFIDQFYEATASYPDFFKTLKTEFNKFFNVGPMRKPIYNQYDFSRLSY